MSEIKRFTTSWFEKCISLADSFFVLKDGSLQDQAEKPCFSFTTHMLSITLPFCNTQKGLCYHSSDTLWPLNASFHLCCACVLCSTTCAHLVIGNLLQVEVAGVDHLHAGVAVVGAAESTPLFGVWIEIVSLLSAALQRNQQWLNWIC